MTSSVPLACIFLMVCFVTLSSVAPRPAPEAYDEESGELQLSDLNDLHIWDDKPLNNSADIPAFKPVPVDMNNNCPSCLPDALLSGRPRW